MALDENQYKTIVESAPNLIWRSGKDALCNYFNTTWLNYTGRTMAQELGNGWAEGVHSDDFDRCLNIYLNAFEKREPFEMVYRLKRYDGEYRWIHDRGVPFYDDSNEFGGYIGSCIDVNEQVTGETWKAMAQRDGLTGVFNRQFFDQEARKLFNTAVRFKKRLCTAMFDIDGFKYFNDHYGHPFGDKILISFVGVLKDNIRDSDLLGRFGGDEFILFLPEAGILEVGNIVSRITEKVTHPFSYAENSRIFISFSCGVAELNPTDTYETFIARADREMYASKREKKHSLPDEEIS